MAAPHCPYCKGPIPPDLAHHGGNCPHCLLEVPGEDAPTDPGAILRARQVEEARRRVEADARQRKVRIAAGIAVAAVLVAVGGYWTWLQQQARHYELSEYYALPMEDVAAAPPEVAAVEVPVPAAPAGSPTGPPRTPRTPRVAAGTTAPPEDAVPEGLSALSGAPSSGGSVSLGGVAIDVANPGVVLSDDAQIADMARLVIRRSGPQLQSCYNQRLKQIPDLAGTWNVRFVIGRTGATSNIDVSGAGRDDRELEQCMSRAVAGWHFMKISHEFPVTVPFRFKAGG